MYGVVKLALDGWVRSLCVYNVRPSPYLCEHDKWLGTTIRGLVGVLKEPLKQIQQNIIIWSVYRDVPDGGLSGARRND